MTRLRGLIAALGALMAGDPVLHASRQRHRAGPTAIEKAHTRAADRAAERNRLSRKCLWGSLNEQDAARYLALRLQRGPAARRMRRAAARKMAAGGRRRDRSAPMPLRLGSRIPRLAREQLLRAEGRPLTGRQWRQLRKASRRQERAG